MAISNCAACAHSSMLFAKFFGGTTAARSCSILALQRAWVCWACAAAAWWGGGSSQGPAIRALD
eukprot:scaffold108798_cov19-Tisochrysis_lutea.AAC.1